MVHYLFRNMPHGLTKTKCKINTRSHYDYISREGKYSKLQNHEEDLVYIESGNLPKWADSAGEFWTAAELYRRTNGRAYRELTLGLQEEFTLEENIELVHTIIQNSGIRDKHAYTFAIHDKESTLEKGHKNIHAHLMFSEKTIEKNRPLPKDKYFCQARTTKDGKVAGGYQSEREWTKEERTIELRKIWASIVNEKFKAKGLTARVTEKSLKTQYKEALERNDEDAELLNREPTPHLGNIYHNPKNMERILERTKQIEQFVEQDTESSIEIVENPISEIDNKILQFVLESAIRKKGRERAKARVREIMERARQKAEREREEKERYHKNQCLNEKADKTIKENCMQNEESTRELDIDKTNNKKQNIAISQQDDIKAASKQHEHSHMTVQKRPRIRVFSNFRRNQGRDDFER